MWAVAGSARRARKVAGPSISGIITSSSTRSGWWLACELDRRRAAIGVEDLVAADQLERVRGDLAHVVVVIDDEHPSSGHAEPPV